MSNIPRKTKNNDIELVIIRPKEIKQVTQNDVKFFYKTLTSILLGED